MVDDCSQGMVKMGHYKPTVDHDQGFSIMVHHFHLTQLVVQPRLWLTVGFVPPETGPTWDLKLPIALLKMLTTINSPESFSGLEYPCFASHDVTLSLLRSLVHQQEPPDFSMTWNPGIGRGPSQSTGRERSQPSHVWREAKNPNELKNV